MVIWATVCSGMVSAFLFLMYLLDIVSLTMVGVGFVVMFVVLWCFIGCHNMVNCLEGDILFKV